MIRRQFRRDRGARRCGVRLQDFADGARRRRWRGWRRYRLGGMEFAWCGGKMLLCRGRIRQFWFRLRRKCLRGRLGLRDISGRREVRRRHRRARCFFA
jgi:hypothetical protein